MNIADLFVNLGIKGTEKTVGALSNVGKGLGNVSSMSLEAKAGILAVLYGFERLVAASGAAGTGLVNFNALTGISAQTLQQWQYAARQAGESNEDLAGSFKGVQNVIANMLLGKGAPEGMQIFAKTVKDFDMTRLRDTPYMMSKIAEAAQKLPKDVGNNLLKSLGASEGFLTSSRRGVFTEANFKKAPHYSDGELKSLDKANIAWSNLGTEIGMAIGDFNAKHGRQLVTDISKITDQVLRLVNALDNLATKVKLFDAIAFIAGKTATAIELAASGTGAVTGAVQDPSKRVPLAKDAAMLMWTAIKDFAEAAIKTGDAITPDYFMQRSTSGKRGAAGNSVDVKQTVIFQGHHDAPQKTADALHKQVGDYVKQSPVKVQGS